MDGNFTFDPTDFTDFSIDLDKVFETRICKPPRTREIAEINLKYAYAEDLAKEIQVDTGTRYFVVINGSFYFGDFIEALIIKNQFKVVEMTISTLSMCENNVDSLALLMQNGYVQNLNLIVSDYFYSHERGNLIEYIYEELDKENRFQLAVAGTHCKLCIFKTACGKYVVIHGSANMRSSGNIEQIVIEENQALYEFNDTYQNAIIDKYKTINKSLRGSKLWQVVQVVAGPKEAAQQEKGNYPPQN
jgi:hypothetical protein